MQKICVTVVYDRRKEVTKTGRGAVEIRMYLGDGVRKYVTINNCDPFEWREYQYSQDLCTQLAIYKHVVETMVKNGEELTIENVNNHIGIDTTKKRENREAREKRSSKTGFIDFIQEILAKEHIKASTLKRRIVVLNSLKRYGRLNCFADLTPKNIKGFDDFLRLEDSSKLLQHLSFLDALTPSACA